MTIESDFRFVDYPEPAENDRLSQSADAYNETRASEPQEERIEQTRLLSVLCLRRFLATPRRRGRAPRPPDAVTLS